MFDYRGRPSRRQLLASIAAISAAPGALSACQTAPDRTLDYALVQALIDSYVDEGKISGAGVAVTTRGAPIRFITAGRIAFAPDAPETTPDSIYRIYSMTKPVTGIAAMQLIERGKLALDQPIADFAPEFASMLVQLNEDTLDARPAREMIRVRHLLTHTSGLSYNIAPGVLAEAYRHAGIIPVGRAGRPEPGDPPMTPTLDEFGRALAQLPLANEPGERWRYSVSLDLLALVIQRASGQTYESFLKDNLFAPLGMHDTDFFVPSDKVSRLTTNYAMTPEGARAVDTPEETNYRNPVGLPCGGAGLVSSTRDYIRFNAMMLNGGALDGVRVLQRETMALASSNLMPAGVFMRPGQGFGAGMSVALGDNAEEGLPIGAYGWSGAAGTNMWVDPAHGAAAVFMTQYMNGASEIRRAVTIAIQTALAR